MTAWYEQSFGEDYLLVYKHRSQREASEQVEAILPLLQVKPGSRILDLCCGTGRHAVELAAKGYEVTGLDLSDVLLSYARRHSRCLPVTYVKGDMRALPFPDESFDAVLNWFTSFGYFAEDRENEKVLSEIARVLAPGGKFFIDFLNRAYTVKHLIPVSEREEGDIRIREERFVDGDYVKKKITVAEGSTNRTYFERVKMYSKDELQAMIERSGLKVDRILGGYDKMDYTEEAPRMLFLGRKDRRVTKGGSQWKD